MFQNYFSILMVAIINAIPLFGAFFLDWEEVALLFTFWFESIVITFYAAIGILFSFPKGFTLSECINEKFKSFAFLLAIFTFYSLFIGMFLLAIFQFSKASVFIYQLKAIVLKFYPSWFDKLSEWIAMISKNKTIPDVTVDNTSIEGFLWVMAILTVAHGISFIENFITRKEYRSTDNSMKSKLLIYVYVLIVALLIAGVTIVYKETVMPALVIFILIRVYFEASSYIEAMDPANKYIIK